MTFNDLNSHYSFVDRDMFMRYQVGMAIGHLPRQVPKFPLRQSPSYQASHNVLTNEPLPNHESSVQDETDGGGKMDGETEGEEADSEDTDSEDTDDEDTDGEETDDEEICDKDIVMFGL